MGFVVPGVPTFTTSNAGMGIALPPTLAEAKLLFSGAAATGDVINLDLLKDGVVVPGATELTYTTGATHTLAAISAGVVAALVAGTGPWSTVLDQDAIISGSTGTIEAIFSGASATGDVITAHLAINGVTDAGAPAVSYTTISAHTLTEIAAGIAAAIVAGTGDWVTLINQAGITSGVGTVFVPIAASAPAAEYSILMTITPQAGSTLAVTSPNYGTPTGILVPLEDASKWGHYAIKVSLVLQGGSTLAITAINYTIPNVNPVSVVPTHTFPYSENGQQLTFYKGQLTDIPLPTAMELMAAGGYLQ